MNRKITDYNVATGSSLLQLRNRVNEMMKERWESNLFRYDERSEECL